MNSKIIWGSIIMVIGALLVRYSQFTYTTQDQVFQAGPITTSTEHVNTLTFSPALGWTLLLGGGILLIAELLRMVAHTEPGHSRA